MCVCVCVCVCVSVCTTQFRVKTAYEWMDRDGVCVCACVCLLVCLFVSHHTKQQNVLHQRVNHIASAVVSSCVRPTHC